ncbi:MAG: hypothetical protein ACPHV3_04175 [Vibrio sp.]
MSLTTYEMAKILEQFEESPEKVMFGKLLQELGNQSEERVRSAAKQVSISTLRDLIYQFQVVLDSRKNEEVQALADQIKQQGFTAEELKAYIEKIEQN